VSWAKRQKEPREQGDLNELVVRGGVVRGQDRKESAGKREWAHVKKEGLRFGKA